MALMEMTAAAATESAKLQRHFGRFDILFFLICTIVGVDTIATVASSGGQAFTWMIVLALVFFVPQALLFAELGTAFPQEGGPYLWTRLAFGHLVGAVNNFLYWITNPVWIGGSLAAACVGGVVIFFNHGNSLSTAMFYVVALVFVWITIARRDRVVPLRQSGCPRRARSPGSWLLGLFTVTWPSTRPSTACTASAAAATSPPTRGFVALTGVLLFNFVGFELPNSAGEEMINPQRDVPFSIARSAIGSVILYALPVLGILIVLPATAVTTSPASPARCRTPSPSTAATSPPTARRRSAAPAPSSATSARSCSSSACSPPASPGSWARTAPWRCPATTARARGSSA